jgi:23S rRNA G2445 N2-methylase RlmL
LAALYREMGEVWKRQFPGWQAWFFSGNLKLSRSIELRATEKIKLFNGPLECRLLHFEIRESDSIPQA